MPGSNSDCQGYYNYQLARIYRINIRIIVILRIIIRSLGMYVKLIRVLRLTQLQ